MNSDGQFWDAWQLEFQSGIPVYKQIINWVCSALASGQLKAGDQLPTIRNLQDKLGINPNTVAKAYREMELRGMLTSERGSGSFVTGLPQSPDLTAEQKKSKLESLYQRMLSEAATHGVSESEWSEFLKQKAKP